MWTVQEAKAKLSNLLQRARDGEPQIIGTKEPCVIISMAEYQRLTGRREAPKLGKWLIENAPKVGDLELPTRDGERPNPFESALHEDEPNA